VYKSDLAPAAKMGEEKLTEAGFEDEECGWNVDVDDTGRAERAILRERSWMVLINSEWTVRRCAERDWRAVERSWKKAVSARRGIITSVGSSVATLPDNALPIHHQYS
jgi:hypothetical protein